MSNNEIIQGFDNEKCDGLIIDLRRIDAVEKGLLIYLKGYIDVYNSNVFQKQIVQVIQAGYTNLIFHCSGINYIASSGISSFAVFLKMVKPMGGSVLLLALKPKVQKTFLLLKSAELVTMKDSLEEAVDFFHGTNSEKSAVLFPKVLNCHVCSEPIPVQKPGSIRCPVCKALLVIGNQGQVFLGNT
jgi:anti-anti-sigma factor